MLTVGRPCYVSLKNNVSTIEMEMTCQAWRPGTEEFVPHQVLADYIQDAARSNDILDDINFNARVDRVAKANGQWEVDVSTLKRSAVSTSIRTDTQVSESRRMETCFADSIFLAIRCCSNSFRPLSRMQHSKHTWTIRMETGISRLSPALQALPNGREVQRPNSTANRRWRLIAGHRQRP